MAKVNKGPASFFLRWSERVRVADVGDPLGLNLRGSARLSSQLLHCITTQTPRARYFSFLPWAVADWQDREKGKPGARDLHAAITLREKALVLGAVAHHGGKACEGGSLVGSESVKPWYERGVSQADLRKLTFAKNPAWNVYRNSLVNLGIFEPTVDAPDTEEDEAGEDDAVEATSFDEIELSTLGRQIADAYGEGVSRLRPIRALADRRPVIVVAESKALGKHGGLCELRDASAADRGLLREVFFARQGLSTQSHLFRRKSLLLLLDLCRQASVGGVTLREAQFRHAVYYGEFIPDEGPPIPVVVPEALQEIADRWRMFYFHHYLGVALEGMFGWLVSELGNRGLSGATLADIVAMLDSREVKREVAAVTGVHLSSKFGQDTPESFFRALEPTFLTLDESASVRLGTRVPPLHQASERNLEDVVRDDDPDTQSLGLAAPMLLLALTLARYRRWEDTSYGTWLAAAAADPYVDLIPPVVSLGLTRQFGDWWRQPWSILAEFVLARYVVQQHQATSYEKTANGERCLLQTEGAKVFSESQYDGIGMGNGRIRSAIQILKDLALLEEREDGVTYLTADGKKQLKEGLSEVEDR